MLLGHLTKVLIYTLMSALLSDSAGLDTFLHGGNFNFLPPIYTCITLIPLIRSSSSIQAERLAGNFCIDDSYFYTRSLATRAIINWSTLANYLITTGVGLFIDCRFCQSSLEAKMFAINLEGSVFQKLDLTSARYL